VLLVLGFLPVISAIGEQFGEALPIRLVMGGLRPATMKPMDEASKVAVRSHWEHVHQASGQPFDFGFFERKIFVYDTQHTMPAEEIRWICSAGTHLWWRQSERHASKNDSDRKQESGNKP
jgi:protein-disulfide isomerase-like protein with CxxC motif